MAKVAAYRHPELMSELNITPFIDVLLVLLIMLILAVPAATNKLPIDLPHGPSPTTLDNASHLLEIDRGGGLHWDGRPISDPQLAGLLAATERSQAVLKMHTDPYAKYDRFDAVLATVKRAGIERLGFVGDQALVD